MAEFMTGTGHESRKFDEEYPIVDQLRDARKINEVRAFFYKKHLDDYSLGTSMEGKAVTDYGASFGLAGLIGAGDGFIEQMLGSFDVDIIVSDNALRCTIKDSKTQ